MAKIFEFYSNPLVERYSSREMLFIFSPKYKFGTWRKLWVALAKAQAELGLPITKTQINELEKHVNNINFTVAEKKEKEVRHDVMAHIFAYGRQCPKSKGIIHLGATSAYVTDNTDLIQIRDAFFLLKKHILNLLNNLKKFAFKYRSLPTLGFTHFQPAQLTTVGKRAVLWIQDLLLDLNDIEDFLKNLKFLGVKGTTGTQASFLHLFNGSHNKVKKLDAKVAKIMGFKRLFIATGQTYSRKIDSKAINLLSGIAQSLHKFTNDIRLLASLKEIEEPFEKKQIGSSAMAYKRNPMRCERIASLAKTVISLSFSTAFTASTQWLERTLDDSANKRISVAQSFLAADAMLLIAQNICQGLVVFKGIISKHINEELPFMASENILMEGVKKGGDRQKLHEIIRRCSMEATSQVKLYGKKNDLLERLAREPEMKLNTFELKNILKPKNFIGRATQQVTEFIKEELNPILKKNKKILSLQNISLKV